ncbi:hypothetical protein COCON_G00171490 [Conger conger]|uniref:Ig-like domain-containing protein n=1 Tax=Conger conger TaxID=82655 RepID=A0A9Q1HUC8_CONCO|nr:hypothetical protein COCON_G00171490 [Conger conger]
MMKIKMRVLSWFVSLICAIRTEGFSVRGPAMPLLVQLGASVTLPCSVDTPIPLHELEVQWMRDSESLVHLFLEGESRPESQSPAYSGRAEFFTEEISKGNFSLLLRNVTTEDRGMYQCVVHTEEESSEANVTVDTERLVVTGADVPVFAYTGADVILNCSVDTHVPLGELEVEWTKTNEEIQVLLFMEGRYRPESQPERFRGRAEFFIEEIPKGNFSMKLKDVKTEDTAQFMCTVHTDRESVSATANLEVGFTNWQLSTLVLSMAAAVFAVLICIPVLRCIQNQDKSNRALLLYYIHVSVPCILISIAFALWGKIEGSFREAYVCIVINVMRILWIFKMSPYKPPGPCHIRLSKLAVPLEMFVITAGFNSMWKPLTVILLLQLSINFQLACFMIFMRSSFFLVLVLFLVKIALLLAFGLISFIYCLVKCRCVCQKVFLLLWFILDITLSFVILGIILENDKELPAWMCFYAFLYVLTATWAFQHNTDDYDDDFEWDVAHILVYVFGSTLSVINSIALATEVFLKAEKGERTVEDFWLIVLPFESLFLAYWVGLQMYASYKRKREKIRHELMRIAQCCRRRVQSPASSRHDQTRQAEPVEMNLLST